MYQPFRFYIIAERFFVLRNSYYLYYRIIINKLQFCFYIQVFGTSQCRVWGYRSNIFFQMAHLSGWETFYWCRSWIILQTHMDQISVCLVQRSQLRCLQRLGRLHKRVKSARQGIQPTGNGMAYFAKEGSHYSLLIIPLQECSRAQCCQIFVKRSWKSR